MNEFETALNENGLKHIQRRELIERTDDTANYLLYSIELYNILDRSMESEQQIDQLHSYLFYQTDFVPAKFKYRTSRVATSFEKVADILESQNLITPLFEGMAEHEEEISDPVDHLLAAIHPYYEETEDLNENKLSSFETRFVKVIENTDITFQSSDFELNSPEDVYSIFQQLADKVRKSSEIYTDYVYETFQYSDYLFDGGSGGWNRNRELAIAFGIYILATGAILAIMYALTTGNPSLLIGIMINIGLALLGQAR